MGLNPLKVLTDITGIGAGQAGTAAGTKVGQDPVGSIGSGVSSGISVGNFIGSISLTQIIMVILGLLLIAAGIFSFDKTRELVVQGAKTAKSAATAVAAAA